jgi:hypothetical protein
VCINTSVIADGAPIEVLNSDVLEKTYGAPMEVLIHGGMPIVLDNGGDNLARRLGEMTEAGK